MGGGGGGLLDEYAYVDVLVTSSAFTHNARITSSFQALEYRPGLEKETEKRSYASGQFTHVSHALLPTYCYTY